MGRGGQRSRRMHGWDWKGRGREGNTDPLHLIVVL